MPGWAGSCWYYLRFMDPHNAEAPFSREVVHGRKPGRPVRRRAEHRTGNLLYTFLAQGAL
ncbi:MAG: hypothetical protein R3E96_08230 [Planctomycetota bacterium]